MIGRHLYTGSNVVRERIEMSGISDEELVAQARERLEELQAALKVCDAMGLNVTLVDGSVNGLFPFVRDADQLRIIANRQIDL